MERPRATSTPSLYAALLAVFLVVLVAILMYPSNPLDRLPGQDNGVFLYGGQQLLAGRTPYQEFWDHKGPLIFFVDAAGLGLAAGSRWGVWFVEFAFLTLAALGLYRTASLPWGRLVGLIAVFVWAYGMRAVGSYHHFRDSNYTETYALLFNSWSVYLWLRSRASRSPHLCLIAVGILTGFSFALRPNNIGIQVAIVLMELFLAQRNGQVRETLKRMVWIAAGSAAIIGCFIAWFWMRGALLELFDQTITYNLVYSRKNLSAATALLVFSFGNRALGWLPLAAYAALASLVVATRRLHGKPSVGVDTSLVILLILGWPLEVALTAASGRALLHYYILWTPHLALTVAALLSFLPSVRMRSLSAPPSLTVALAVAAALLAVTSIEAIVGYARIARHILSHPRQAERTSSIVAYLSKETVAGDTILVWGNDVWINFLTQRPAPDRYAYQYPLFLPGYSSPRKIESFLAALELRPPALIVEPIVDSDEIVPLNMERRLGLTSRVEVPAGMQAVFAFVCRNYRMEGEIGDVLIYRRRSEPLGVPSCE